MNAHSTVVTFFSLVTILGAAALHAQPAPGADHARPADAAANLPSDTGAQATTPGGAVTGAGQAQMDRHTPKATGTARPLSDTRMAWERTHRASRIIGTHVFNRDGQRLGDIKEIVLDPRRGEVSYAVLSFGGFLGLRERLFALPWKALDFDHERQVFVVDTTREQLRQTGGFHPDHWPGTTGQTPGTHGGAGPRLAEPPAAGGPARGAAAGEHGAGGAAR